MKRILRATFFVFVVLSWFALAAFFMSMMACNTSPELDGDQPIIGEVAIFGSGAQDQVIINFAWGVTYQVQVRNVSTCSFNCDLYWSVFDGDVLRWSGSCCGFSMAPMENKTIDVRIPSFELTPPTCNLAVLRIRTY